MTGWRGIFLGALGLSALEFVLRTPQGAARTGGILTGIGTLAQAFLDPTKPAIKDRRKSGGSGPSTSNGVYTPAPTPSSGVISA